MQKNIDKSTREDIIAGTERNGTERNGTERNGTERNGNLRSNVAFRLNTRT